MKNKVSKVKAYRPKKPDPIKLGKELADYIKSQQRKLQEIIDSARVNLSDITSTAIENGLHESTAIGAAFVLQWEMQFWQAKALGEKLP